MEIFNIVCGICSIMGLLVSLFTAGKVAKISKKYREDDHSKVINMGKRNTYYGSYTGRDSINGTGSGEQE